MTTRNSPHAEAMDDGADHATTMSRTQVIDILSLGATTPSRPVDFVIERLATDDGAQAMAMDIESRFHVNVDDLVDGAVPLETMRGVKDGAKRAFEDHAKDVSAVALYFLAVSSGLASYGVNLSSRTGAELIETMIDFGEACPAPWRAMVRSAVLCLADMTDES